LEVSGYTRRSNEFPDSIRILDSETRLITPTVPEGQEADVSSSEGEADGSRPTDGDPLYYQLTHDYLVPSLRDWLTRKQKETRRGRA